MTAETIYWHNLDGKCSTGVRNNTIHDTIMTIERQKALDSIINNK